MTFLSTLLAGGAIGAAIGYAVASLGARGHIRRLNRELFEQFLFERANQITVDELTATLRAQRHDLERTVTHASHRKD